MIRELQNTKRYSIFFICVLLLCTLSIMPRALRYYDDWTMVLPMATLGIGLAIIGIIRPGYFHLTAEPHLLKIQTHILAEDFISIPKDQFVSYKLDAIMGGVCYNLSIIKQTPKGMAQSPVIRVGLLSQAQVEELREILDGYIVSHKS